ncbi:hypothetical protein [Dactylosporangium sp. NPDC049140]|uniref:hypothetical protein n=1 Tax=Dactylosporangium sp. NPDC049140 TaxID=3155647 RepID=UPI0033D31E4F
MSGLASGGHYGVMLAAGGLDWGNIPDWVQALGGILAFGGFTIGLLYEIRRRRIDDELAAADRMDAWRQQARLVFFQDIRTEPGSISGVLRNASDAPIFDIYMRIDRPDDPKLQWPNPKRSLRARVVDLIRRRARWSDKLEPTPNVVNWVRAMPYLPEPNAHLLDASSTWPDQLDPGESAEFDIRVNMVLEGTVGRHESLPAKPVFGATFTDCNGRRWARVGNAPPELNSHDGWRRSRLQRMSINILGRELEPADMVVHKRGPRYFRTQYVPSQRQSDERTDGK